MMGGMLNVFSVTNAIAGIIFAGFAALLFWGSTRRSARAYALIACALAVWSLAMTLSYAVSDPAWLIFLNRFDHWIGGVIGTLFFAFALIYDREDAHLHNWFWSLAAIEGIFAYLTLATPFIVAQTFIVQGRNLDLGWEYGTLGLLFYANFFLPFLAGFLVLSHKVKVTEDPAAKRELSHVIWGTFFGSLLGTSVNVVFPFFGFFWLAWLGPILTLSWVAIVSYAIMKRRILSIKLIAAHAFVLGMITMLAVNIFVPNETQLGIPGRLLLFFAFALVGYFFIRSIAHTEKQKAELARLSGELTDFNAHLRERVEEGTRQVIEAKTHADALIEELPSGLLEYAPDQTLLRVNRAAETILGVSRGGILGTRFLPEERSPTDRSAQIVTAQIPDGSIKVIRDITREKLAAQSKSEFISIAAHQMRTPLSIMKWGLHALVGGDMGALAPAQQEPLARATETNDHLISLVNDLLDVARIDEGRFGFAFGPHDLAEVAQTAAREYAQAAAEKKITLLFTPPETPIPPFTFDASKIALVIRILLDNALAYTPAGGLVELGIRAIPEKESAEIEVKDNGIGIPPRERDHIFTKFFRATNAMALTQEGAGLGLFIVKNILTRHGGRIAVESKEHKGSVFRVELPVRAEAIPQAREPTL